MKQFTYLISSVLCLLFLFGTVTFAEEESIDLAEDAKAAILLERDTGKIIIEKNSHEQLPPARMTKVMTLLLVMEAIDAQKLSLDEPIRISEKASSMGGSQVFLETGEEMTV